MCFNLLLCHKDNDDFTKFQGFWGVISQNSKVFGAEFHKIPKAGCVCAVDGVINWCDCEWGGVG